MLCSPQAQVIHARLLDCQTQQQDFNDIEPQPVARRAGVRSVISNRPRRSEFAAISWVLPRTETVGARLLDEQRPFVG